MSAGAGGPGTSTGRPHVHRDRSPPVDDSLGRQDRRHAGRRGGRGRNPRRADGPKIVLPPARTEASVSTLVGTIWRAVYCHRRALIWFYFLREKEGENYIFFTYTSYSVCARVCVSM